MNTPLISIIIPVYNVVDILQSAINSVRANDYSQKELIIIDGGSSDGTLEIIKRNDDLISKWVSEPDQGIYHAMQKGIEFAQGDWLYFLGADDILYNCLHEVAPNLRTNKNIYYGDVYYSVQKIIYDGEFNQQKLIKKNICHQSIFFPKNVFEHYRFNLNYPYLADYEFNLRCWGEKLFRYVYTPVLIAAYNDYGLSKLNRDEFFYSQKDALIKTFFGKGTFTLLILQRYKQRVVNYVTKRLRSNLDSHIE